MYLLETDNVIVLCRGSLNSKYSPTKQAVRTFLIDNHVINTREQRLESQNKVVKRKKRYGRAEETKKQKICAEIRGLCPICKVNNTRGFHHIKPLSQGGANTPSNKVRLCENCHNIVESLTDKGNCYCPALVKKIQLSL